MAAPPPPPKWSPARLTLRNAVRPGPAPQITVTPSPDPTSPELVIAHLIDGAWVREPEAPPSE